VARIKAVEKYELLLQKLHQGVSRPLLLETPCNAAVCVCVCVRGIEIEREGTERETERHKERDRDRDGERRKTPLPLKLPAPASRSNRFFQALDLRWRSTESGSLWHESRQMKKTSCSTANCIPCRGEF